jgi:hypothetical protein
VFPSDTFYELVGVLEGDDDTSDEPDETENALPARAKKGSGKKKRRR